MQSHILLGILFFSNSFKSHLSVTQSTVILQEEEKQILGSFLVIANEPSERRRSDCEAAAE